MQAVFECRGILGRDAVIKVGDATDDVGVLGGIGCGNILLGA